MSVNTTLSGPEITHASSQVSASTALYDDIGIVLLIKCAFDPARFKCSPRFRKLLSQYSAGSFQKLPEAISSQGGG